MLNGLLHPPYNIKGLWGDLSFGIWTTLLSSPVSLARFPSFEVHFAFYGSTRARSCRVRVVAWGGWVSHALPHAVGHASSCAPHRLWQAQFTAMMMMMTTVTSRFVSNLLNALASSVRPLSSFPCRMTYALPSIVGRIASPFSFWRVERGAQFACVAWPWELPPLSY